MGYLIDIPESESEKQIWFRRIKVYVEAESDETVLGKCFFLNNRYLRFIAVANPPDSGGCNKVKQKVSEAAEMSRQGLPVWGLIDRDVLFNPLNEVFWETDDKLFFEESSKIDKNILYLHRWEIENYMQLPELLSKSYATLTQDYEDPDFEKTLIKLGKRMTSVMAANAVAKTLTLSYRHDKLKGINSVKEVEEFCLKWLLVKAKENNAKSRYQEALKKLKLFFTSEPQNKAISWERMNRIIDGKAVFEELERLGRTAYLNKNSDGSNTKDLEPIAGKRKLEVAGLAHQIEEIDPYLKKLKEFLEAQHPKHKDYSNP